MANNSYAGQLLDEIKTLKEENEKLKKNNEERTSEVLKLERQIQKLAENPYNSYALCLIKEIDQLNSQIEKMKCCANCKEYSETYRTCCRDTQSEMCVDSSKWEMKE